MTNSTIAAPAFLTIEHSVLLRAYSDSAEVPSVGEYVTITSWKEYGRTVSTLTGGGATPEISQAETDAARDNQNFEGGEDMTALVVVGAAVVPVTREYTVRGLDGYEFGVFSGTDERDALETMASEQGYPDFATFASTLGHTVEESIGNLRVTVEGR